MKIGNGFRYVLEYRDPVSGWQHRMSGDTSDTLLKIAKDLDHRVWRVRDRSTDTVITRDGAHVGN